MPFLEFRDVARAKERQHRRRGERQEEGSSDRRFRVPDNAAEQLPVAGFRPAHHRRLAQAEVAAGQEQHRQRRDRGQRDDQRGQHRERIGDPERREQPSRQPRQYQDRQHDEQHREGGVDDGAANFEAGVEHHRRDRARRREIAVLAQAADDVLDIDDSVVDHHADRDRQAAQRHRVERHAETLQDDDRRQQRQRDREARDRRRAQVEQEEEDDEDDQHAAGQQRTAHVAGCGVDEGGRPEQVGMQRDAGLFEAGPQARQRRLQPLADAIRVGAVLLVDVEDDGGPALDRRRAERRRRRLRHRRDVAQEDAALRRRREHGTGDLARRQRLAFGGERDALIGGIDKAAAAHPGGTPRRLQHVVDADAEAFQRFRMDLHRERALVAAEDRDAGHAGDRQEPRPHRPFGDRAQVHQRHPRRGEPGHQHDVGR